jgi:type IV pilus assembly protein PilC
VEQAEDKKLQSALVSVQADVESGSSFSDALATQTDVFPPLMVSLVRVGETGGFLGDALDAVAETYAKEADLRNKIKSATTYPLVVLIIAILGVVAMVTFVVPVFEGMFSNIGSELPLPTRIIVAVSHNMVWILPLLIVLAIAGTLWWNAKKNTVAVRRRVDPLKLKIPVFGPLNTKIAVARFARSLSMMLGSGVPLLNALSIVGQAADNWKIEQAVLAIQESVRQGRSFAGPLAKAEVFPPMVAQMVAVGEESGTLADMLASIADFYENEVDTAAAQLTSTIEPVLIVGIGVIIGGMVISLYLPIFTLYGDLSKTG